MTEETDTMGQAAATTIPQETRAPLPPWRDYKRFRALGYPAKLKPSAYKLYMHLGMCVEGKAEWVWETTYEELAEELGLSRRCVITATQELVDIGLLSRRRGQHYITLTVLPLPRNDDNILPFPSSDNEKCKKRTTESRSAKNDSPEVQIFPPEVQKTSLRSADFSISTMQEPIQEPIQDFTGSPAAAEASPGPFPDYPEAELDRAIDAAMGREQQRVRNELSAAMNIYLAPEKHVAGCKNQLAVLARVALYVFGDTLRAAYPDGRDRDGHGVTVHGRLAGIVKLKGGPKNGGVVIREMFKMRDDGKVIDGDPLDLLTKRFSAPVNGGYRAQPATTAPTAKGRDQCPQCQGRGLMMNPTTDINDKTFGQFISCACVAVRA